MKTLLDIGTFEQVNSEAGTLVVEIGDTYAVLSLLDEDKKRVEAFQVLSFDPLEEILPPLLEQLAPAGSSFRKVIISPAFPQALLVPHKLFRKESSLLEAVYEMGEVQQLHDVVGEWQVVNCYAVPYFLYKTLAEAFPSAAFLHAYTPLLKSPDAAAEHQLTVHFVHNIFRVLVKKSRQLQLVQTFVYETPADVAYLLLKICKEYHMAPADTALLLSGLIGEDSDLLHELKTWFRQVYFTTAAGLSSPGKNLPGHYFSSLHNLAVCAS
ncbi:DUF3822 family protein [Paraflavisolibacter sp. H34]|uniref:DUF3822 family protein n=1 Tax=Huijunlia imazamoxiresistens TaxID=3127457 RepID=UPI003018D48B